MLSIIPIHNSSFNFGVETSHLQLFQLLSMSFDKCCSRILKLAFQSSFLNLGNLFITLIQMNEKHYYLTGESVNS